MILLAALKRISNDFTILKEARREVLEDLMDIESAKTVLEWIETGRTKVSVIETSMPSPFAFSIAYQGTLDTMKIEDRHAFLRRMHEYVLAKIAQKENFLKRPLLAQTITKPFKYQEYWEKEGEVKKSESVEVKGEGSWEGETKKDVTEKEVGGE